MCKGCCVFAKHCSSALGGNLRKQSVCVMLNLTLNSFGFLQSQLNGAAPEALRSLWDSLILNCIAFAALFEFRLFLMAI